ncbi:MAG: hypothetical protein ACRD3S_11445, partial [Terracidiphilus sp.]
MPPVPPNPGQQQELLLDGADSPLPPARPRSLLTRLLAALHPTHAHSVFSATVVLMVSTFLSRMIGLVRVKYI